MRTLSIFILCSFASFSQAQWSPVTSYTGDLLMTAPGVGFRAENVFMSPSSGWTYHIHYTTNEWMSETMVHSEGGGTSFCCTERGMERTSDSSMFYIHNFGAEKPRSLVMQAGTAVVSGEEDFGSQILSPLAPVNDGLCYYMAFAGEDTIGVYSATSDTPEPLCALHLPGTTVEGLDFLDAERGVLAITAQDGMGSVLMTSDGGVHWQIVQQEPEHAYRAVKYVDDATIWVVGDAGTITRTTDGGANWTSVDVSMQEDLWSVDAYSPQQVWIAGTNGFVSNTDDGGATWLDHSLSGAMLVKRIQTLHWAVYAYTSEVGSDQLFRYTGPDAGLSDISSADASWWQQDGEGLRSLIEGPNVAYEVDDMAGRCIRLGTYSGQIPMTDRPPGVYILRLRTPSGVRIAKVLWPGR